MLYRGRQAARLNEVVNRSVPVKNAMLDVEYVELSHPGRVRTSNEDYFGHVLPPTPEKGRSHGWLFALADGVGGHDRGEVASRIAIESLLAGFYQGSTGEQPGARLQRLLQLANTRILEAGVASPVAGAAMATTIVACALRYDRLTVAHVGDSRCYLVRHNHAEVLTRDHTIAREHVRLGFLSEDEVAGSEMRHVLSRSLGSDLFVAVEVSEHSLLPNDVLLLCSDGLHGAIKPAEIAGIIMREPDLDSAANALVALANERDGSDNITAQLIRVLSVERVGMYRGRPYKLR